MGGLYPIFCLDLWMTAFRCRRRVFASTTRIRSMFSALTALRSGTYRASIPRRKDWASIRLPPVQGLAGAFLRFRLMAIIDGCGRGPGTDMPLACIFCRRTVCLSAPAPDECPCKLPRSKRKAVSAANALSGLIAEGAGTFRDVVLVETKSLAAVVCLSSTNTGLEATCSPDEHWTPGILRETDFRHHLQRSPFRMLWRLGNEELHVVERLSSPQLDMAQFTEQRTRLGQLTPA